MGFAPNFLLPTHKLPGVASVQNIVRGLRVLFPLATDDCAKKGLPTVGHRSGTRMKERQGRAAGNSPGRSLRPAGQRRRRPASAGTAGQRAWQYRRLCQRSTMPAQQYCSTARPFGSGGVRQANDSVGVVGGPGGDVEAVEGGVQNAQHPDGRRQGGGACAQEGGAGGWVGLRKGQQGGEHGNGEMGGRAGGST